jgi:hypothetical protein
MSLVAAFIAITMMIALCLMLERKQSAADRECSRKEEEMNR